MNTITLTMPDAWITEDGVLFLAAKTYTPLARVFGAGNEVLEKQCYSERITPQNAADAHDSLWVDPMCIADERWPDSGVSKVAVSGWTKLHRFDISDLESSDLGSVPN